jgi:lipopolysaccharide assembly outer membrane protein LptD (OstA)
MRLLVLGVVMACQSTLFLPQAMSQNNQATEPQRPQPEPLFMLIGAPQGTASLSADSMQRDISHAAYNPVIQLSGNVEITTKAVLQQKGKLQALVFMVVRADEADYHEDTGEIEARGSVRISSRLDPAR